MLEDLKPGAIIDDGEGNMIHVIAINQRLSWSTSLINDVDRGLNFNHYHMLGDDSQVIMTCILSSTQAIVKPFKIKGKTRKVRGFKLGHVHEKDVSLKYNLISIMNMEGIVIHAPLVDSLESTVKTTLRKQYDGSYSILASEANIVGTDLDLVVPEPQPWVYNNKSKKVMIGRHKLIAYLLMQNGIMDKGSLLNGVARLRGEPCIPGHGSSYFDSFAVGSKGLIMKVGKKGRKTYYNLRPRGMLEAAKIIAKIQGTNAEHLKNFEFRR